MNVPLAGIMFGYFFVACAWTSASDNAGPKVRRARGSRLPWDGGRKRSGFSRIRDLLVMGLEEAWRTGCSGLGTRRECTRSNVSRRGSGLVDSFSAIFEDSKPLTARM